jgi:hypothetical protein
MHCKNCGSNLRRIPRKGVLQQKVYTLFGYYPWECPICRAPILLRKQHQRKSHKVQESGAD